jgi:uncharacterized membrane protein
MIMAALAVVVAAGFVVLVFLTATLHPAQDDKENTRSENEDENDERFHKISGGTVSVQSSHVETVNPALV